MLSGLLARYADDPGAVVMGLPRGGVVVADEVAGALRAPLDAFTVRKLGVPGQEELAMGAIASGSALTVNEEIVAALRIPREFVEQVAASERRELERREHLYRGARPFSPLDGRTVILVDDGMATGSSMRAAVTAVRIHAPARIVVAVPVASSAANAAVAPLVDALACACVPDVFGAVGCWYRDFAQVADADVRRLLERRWSTRSAGVDA